MEIGPRFTDSYLCSDWLLRSLWFFFQVICLKSANKQGTGKLLTNVSLNEVL